MVPMVDQRQALTGHMRVPSARNESGTIPRPHLSDCQVAIPQIEECSLSYCGGTKERSCADFPVEELQRFSPTRV